VLDAGQLTDPGPCHGESLGQQAELNPLCPVMFGYVAAAYLPHGDRIHSVLAAGTMVAAPTARAGQMAPKMWALS
jgi:hypothetical protein